MENSDEDVPHLQFLSRTPSAGSTTDDVSPEREREQRGPREEPAADPPPGSERAAQEEPKPATHNPSLGHVELRIQQLQNRLSILQNAQEVTKKAAGGVETADGQSPAACGPGGDGGGCELEAVQQELQELQVAKKQLEKQGKSSGVTDQMKAYKAETQGIYTLPHLHLHQGKPAPTADQVIPVERLGKISTITRCPSCGEVVCTETQSKTSEATWLFCCLLSMSGCIAGCCLIPFFMDSLKKVCHYCPNCQATVHVRRPF